ncbi:28S ribosomal protein S35, mitochondrial [Chamberlinius hualienensis]
MAAFVDIVLKGEMKMMTLNAIISPFIRVRPANARLMSMFSSSRSEDSKAPKKEEDGEFRTLNIRGESQERVRVGRGRGGAPRPPVMPPRYKSMPIDQDWPSVWPTAQSFKASVVPLPLRQGINEKDAPPSKYGNAELMKIPNFLHLTPPAIERHCEAIKKFCTPWPAELTDDAKCEKHFPVSVTTNDYLYSSPTIREPKARIVTLKIKLSNLKLNAHAKDKFLRLVGDRYNVKTGDVTIVTDRCPLRKQNYDYGMYLLTALYFESWKTEPWESEKDEDDAECYDWDKSQSKKTTLNLLKQMKECYLEKNQEQAPSFLSNLTVESTDQDIVNLEEVKAYNKAVTDIHNDGECNSVVNEYKLAVLKLLNLKSLPVAS